MLSAVGEKMEPLKYAAAWKTYRGRWILACLSLLGSFGLVILFAVFLPGVPEVLAVLLGVSPCIVCYLWFLRWPCPRCGQRFTMPDAHALKRSERGLHCGLKRNFIPDSPSYPVS